MQWLAMDSWYSRGHYISLCGRRRAPLQPTKAGLAPNGQLVLVWLYTYTHPRQLGIMCVEVVVELRLILQCFSHYMCSREYQAINQQKHQDQCLGQLEASLALSLSLGLEFSEVFKAPSYLCLCETRVVHVDAYLRSLARLCCYCICGVAAGGVQWMRGPWYNG